MGLDSGRDCVCNSYRSVAFDWKRSDWKRSVPGKCDPALLYSRLPTSGILSRSADADALAFGASGVFSRRSSTTICSSKASSARAAALVVAT